MFQDQMRYLMQKTHTILFNLQYKENPKKQVTFTMWLIHRSAIFFVILKEINI